MPKTQLYNFEDTDLDEDALLDCSQLSDTELDYEYSESLLESDDGRSKVHPAESSSSAIKISSPVSKSSDLVKSIPSVPQNNFMQENQPTTQYESKRDPTQAKVKVDLHFNHSDCTSIISDVLDFQRMADKYVDMGKRKIIEKILSDTGEFNYDIVTGVDRLLEEATNILFKYHDKLDRTTRASLKNSILELHELPHTYVPMRPEKQRNARVKGWLKNHTSRPKPDTCGFTMRDSIQLKRYVTRPKISTNNSNTILGKRKRDFGNCDSDDISDVCKRSSKCKRLRAR